MWSDDVQFVVVVFCDDAAATIVEQFESWANGALADVSTDRWM